MTKLLCIFISILTCFNLLAINQNEVDEILKKSREIFANNNLKLVEKKIGLTIEVNKLKSLVQTKSNYEIARNALSELGEIFKNLNITKYDKALFSIPGYYELNSNQFDNLPRLQKLEILLSKFKQNEKAISSKNGAEKGKHSKLSSIDKKLIIDEYRQIQLQTRQKINLILTELAELVSSKGELEGKYIGNLNPRFVEIIESLPESILTKSDLEHILFSAHRNARIIVQSNPPNLLAEYEFNQLLKKISKVDDDNMSDNARILTLNTIKNSINEGRLYIGLSLDQKNRALVLIDDAITKIEIKIIEQRINPYKEFLEYSKEKEVSTSTTFKRYDSIKDEIYNIDIFLVDREDKRLTKNERKSLSFISNNQLEKYKDQLIRLKTAYEYYLVSVLNIHTHLQLDEVKKILADIETGNIKPYELNSALFVLTNGRISNLNPPTFQDLRFQYPLVSFFMWDKFQRSLI
jgi:hypothetical protein